MIGALAYPLFDDSLAAKRWRADPDLGLAREALQSAAWGSTSTYQHPDRRIILSPGQENHSISLSELAFAFELGLGPLSIRRSIDVGIGIRWFGIFTQQVRRRLTGAGVGVRAGAGAGALAGAGAGAGSGE